MFVHDGFQGKTSVPSVGINTIGQAMMNAKFGDTIFRQFYGVYREHVFH